VADGKEATATLQRREELARNPVQVAAAWADARRNLRARDLPAQNGVVDPAIVNALPMQPMVGVGARDDNEANHPIYHGPW